MQPGARQHLGDLDLAQAGAQGLQTLHQVADEGRELVHRLRRAQQRRRASFVQTVRP